jgi:hypothetical protein
MPNNPYADIINLPHHVSTVHPQMTMAQRAAQFSPFAALVGYEDVIEETTRQTDSKRELDESEKAELNRKLSILASLLKEKPVVEIEYFVPDKTKAGGEYVFKSGEVVKIQPVQKKLVLSDGTVIRIDDIADISGELFAGEF